MLSDEKILLTGPSGMVGHAFAHGLSSDNEVWGVARFGNPDTRARLDALGVTTRAIDLATGDLDELPDDFTIVVHLAFERGGAGDFDRVVQSIAAATGRVLTHCRTARAALVMSSHAIYTPHDDPWHPAAETDDLGGATPPWAPTSPAAKLTMEAVARGAASALDLPVTVARLNTVFGPFGGLPYMHLAAVLRGDPVTVGWDPAPHSLIHTDDMLEQLPALLDAASVPATIVNWGGDTPVTVQEWCQHGAALAGRTATVIARPVPGVARGSVASAEKRRAITGPCRVDWREAFDREAEIPAGEGGD